MLNALRQNISIKCTNVLIQSVRYKNVINTRRPRNDHFWAKKMKLFYAPRKPKEFDCNLPMAYKCRKQYKVILRKLDNQEEENPYEKILANEINETLMQSKMLLIIHRNPASEHDYFNVTKKFIKAGMQVIKHGKHTVNMAVENTKFVNVMNLYQKDTRTWLISCPEVKLNVALGLLKKNPYFILLAGIVEDRFLTRSQIEEYGKVCSIDEVRAQLVATLSTPAMQLVQNLTQHQMITVGYLDEYIRMKSAAEESSANKVETLDSTKSEISDTQETEVTDSTKPGEENE